DSFLNALFHLFNKHQDIRENAEVYFLGIFPEESRALIHSLNLEKYIHIFEYKPYKESLSYICGADLALVILGNLPTVKDVLPEKLFDYIGAKKPLIAVTGNGALKEFVEEYSLGKTVSNDNINEIERIIYDYYLDIKNEEEIYNPKDCSGFERKVTAEKLSEVLNKAVQ
ncbi:hypothetical protein KAS50_04170, partial [bacterium]|nr:hypothetical protein [bacterium]